MLTSIFLLVALVIKGLIIWKSKCHQKNPLVLSDGYVKYEEAEVHRSATMQDFGDNEIKKIKWPTGGHFGFYNCKICQGLFLCETLHFALYSRSSYFAFFLVN